MKRVGSCFYILVYIAVLCYLFISEYTVSKNQDFTEGRINNYISCGEMANEEGKYKEMYQANYLYVVGNETYEIVEECKETLINEVDIIYESENPKNAKVYQKTWRVYVLMIMTLFSFTIVYAGAYALNRKVKPREKRIAIGISCILFSVGAVFALGGRMDFMSCLSNMELVVLFPFTLFVIGVMEIFSKEGISSLKKIFTGKEEA